MEYQILTTNNLVLLADMFTLIKKNNTITFQKFKNELNTGLGMQVFKNRVNVLLQDDIVIGFTAYGLSEDTAYLHYLVINSNYQGQGLGSQLFLRSIEDIIRFYGKNRLNIGVPLEVDPSIYLKFGAKKVSDRPIKIGEQTINMPIYRIRDLKEVYKNFKGEELKL